MDVQLLRAELAGLEVCKENRMLYIIYMYIYLCVSVCVCVCVCV